MFSESKFLKSSITLANFIFSGKITFYSDRLNKSFRGSLISPKRLITLKFILSCPGLLLVFSKRKASFKSFIDSEFFSL